MAIELSKDELLIYYEQKLELATDPDKIMMIKKQIDLIKDSIIIYRLHRST